MRYAKIFDSIWEGSMRGKSDPLFVFMNLLTHSDEHGIVDRHWRAIADETGLPQDRIVAALTFLESPDEESRTPNEDGRRIVRLDEHRSWGWRIVNHKYYRELCTKVQNAERQAKFRKNNSSVTDSNAVVTHHNILPVGVGVDVDASVSVFSLDSEEINKEVKEGKKEKAEKKPRPRVPLMDALASIEGDPLQITGPKWGKIAKALADIKAVCPDLTPEEITRRIKNYKENNPTWACTSTAIASNWASCEHGKKMGILGVTMEESSKSHLKYHLQEKSK